MSNRLSERNLRPIVSFPLLESCMGFSKAVPRLLGHLWGENTDHTRDDCVVGGADLFES